MDKRIDLIINNLKEVYDPEIPVNVYDLGLIYNVDVDEKKIANLKKCIIPIYEPGLEGMVLKNVNQLLIEPHNLPCFL